MTHPYMQHVDVRDTGGFYLGAITYALQRNKLEIRSCDMPVWPEKIVGGDEELPPVYIRKLSIPLTVWIICERQPGTILWSERDCIVVRDGDVRVLLDGGYIILYNRDPFIDDKRAWISDFIAYNRR